MKKTTAMLLSLILLVITMPALAWFSFADNTPSQISKYYEGKESGEITTAMSGDTSAETSTENTFGTLVENKGNGVKVNKRITATDTENVFDLDLTVKTISKRENLMVPPDAAVTLVLDVSTSMHIGEEKEGGGNYPNDIQAMSDSCISFINSYANNANDAERWISVVAFCQNVKLKSNWYDVATTNGKKSALALVGYNKLKDMRNGGTNTMAGLTWANSKISEKTDISNRYVVLMTDGNPNTISLKGGDYTEGVYYNSDENMKKWNAEDAIPNWYSLDRYKAENGTTNYKNPAKYGDPSIYSADRASLVAKEIKAIANLYAIGYGPDLNNYIYDQFFTLKPNEQTGKTSQGRQLIRGSYWLENEIATDPSMYFNADSSSLQTIFESIMGSITEDMEAWEVVDPMGDNIELLGVYKDSTLIGTDKTNDLGGIGVSLNDAKNEIRWNLRKAYNVQSSQEGTGSEIYYTKIYHLKYRVRLNNLAEDFDVGEDTIANKATTVKYDILVGGETSERGTAFFNIPSVKALGDEKGNPVGFKFIKVNTKGGAVSGAQYKLSSLDTGSNWSQLVTSTAAGLVEFKDIPSGHDYKLEEISAPAGYAVNSRDYTVKVNYGVAKLYLDDEEVDGTSGYSIVDDYYSIKVNKVWTDSDDLKNDRPDSVTVNLKQGEKILGTATLNSGNNWTHVWGVGDDLEGKLSSTETYTVTENTVAGYNSNVAKNEDGSFTVTNTAQEQKLGVRVQKEWVDGDDDVDSRQAITVKLFNNGTDTKKSLTLNATNGWKGTFYDLPEKSDGHTNNYTIEESSVPDGYKSSMTGSVAEGFKITNTRVHTITYVSSDTDTGAVTNDEDSDLDPSTEEATGSTAEPKTGYHFVNWTDPEGNIVGTNETLTPTKPDDGWKDITYTANFASDEDTAYTVEYYYSDAEGKYPNAANATDERKGTTDAEVEITDTDKVPHPENLNPALTGAFALDESKNTAWSATIAGDGTTVLQVYFKKLPKLAVEAENGGGKYSGEPYKLTAVKSDVEGAKIEYSLDEGESWSTTEPSQTDVLVDEDGKVIGKEVWVRASKDGYEQSDIVKKKITVTPRTVTLTSGDGSKPYDATALEVNTQESVTVGGDGWVEGEGATYNVVGTQTDIGTSKNYFRGDEDSGTSGNPYVLNDNTKAENYTISLMQGTLEVTPPKITISGSKTWEDGNSANRPESITIRLLADGTETKSETVTSADDWKWSFSDVPKFKEGTTTDIEYTVTEDTVPGYKAVINGYDIKNVKLIDVTATVKWEDSSNQDGVRPEKVTLQLYKKVGITEAVAVEGKSAELTTWTDNTGSTTFSDLPEYENGTKVIYTVKEVEESNGKLIGKNEAEYGVAYSDDGLVVTNSYTPETVKVEGNKIWDDDNDRDRKRPESIKIRLLADGTEKDAKTVKASDDWKWSFADLPKFSGGVEIKYTITEDAVSNYTASYNGYNVTNTYTPEKTSVTVTKVWEDNNNQDGIRSESVVIQLYADNVAVTGKTLTLNDDNNWQGTFTELPENNDGEAIAYTVAETSVPQGYTSVGATGSMAAGYVITNTHSPDTVDVTAIVIWDDANNQDGKRPTEVKLQLCQTVDGQTEPVANRIAVLDNADKWINNEKETTFEGLPKYKDGKEITYFVRELTVGDSPSEIADTGKLDENYTVKYSSNSLVVTNSYSPETVTISGTKTWDDNDDQDGIRPEVININLYADSELVTHSEVRADEQGDWKWQFANLDKYSDGTEIIYTISEDEVEGYTSEVNGYNVKNTHIPGTTKLEVNKVWNDDEGKAAVRPESVSVQLYEKVGDDEPAAVASQLLVLNESNKWKGTFNNLPENRDGEEIEYSIKEISLDGYNSVITGDATKGFTITNTSVEVKDVVNSVSMGLLKVDAETAGIALEGAKFSLTKNGSDQSETITTGTEGTALIEFTEEGTYTLTETDPPEGYVIGNEPPTYTIIINKELQEIELNAGKDKWVRTYNLEIKDFDGFDRETRVLTVENYKEVIDKTTVNVKKFWNDSDDKDGIRPDSITVNLYANGEKVRTQSITEADGWKWTFTNLDQLKDGKEIKYSITEEPVDGYKTNINGYNITNTHEVENPGPAPKPRLTKIHIPGIYNPGDYVTFFLSTKNVYDTEKTIMFIEQPGVHLLKSVFLNVQPGQRVTTLAIRKITEEDVIRGFYLNTASAWFSGETKPIRDRNTVLLFMRQHLEVTKTSDVTPGETVGPGDVINYTIKVRNTGNVTLNDIVVTDEMTGMVGLAAERIGSLAPGESKIITTSYVVTEEDVLTGSVTNNAVAECPGRRGGKVKAHDDVTDPTDPMDTSVIIDKNVTNHPKNGKAFTPGEKIKYEIVVSNVGNVTVKNVLVKDILTGDEWTLETLGPGETHSYQAVYVVTDKDGHSDRITNVAIAEGEDPTDKPIDEPSDEASSETEPTPAGVKTGDDSSLLGWAAAMLSSILGLCIALVRRRKYRE